MPGASVRVPLVMVLVLLIQSSLLGAMKIGIVRPDAMILLPIAAGMIGGAERGAVLGFFAGMATDLFLQTPMGLSALTYCVVGFGVGSIHRSVLRAAWWIGPLTAFVASGIGVVLFVLIGAVVGVAHLIRPDLGYIVLGTALINAPISIAVTRLMTWAWPTDPAHGFAR